MPQNPDRGVDGQDHIDVAKSYCCIGNVYRELGRYDEALAEYDKCLKIQIEVFDGQDHTDVAISKFNLALLLKDVGQANESKRLFAEAAATFRRALGADHPHTQMAERNAAA